MKSFCRGWCSANLCNVEELKCEDIGTRNGGKEIAVLSSLNASEVIDEHWYCRSDVIDVGDSVFHRIDRTDEEIQNTLDVSDSRIDYSYTLQTVIMRRADPGSPATSPVTKQGERQRIVGIYMTGVKLFMWVAVM